MTPDTAVDGARDDLIGTLVEWQGDRWTVAVAQHDREHERDRGHWHLTLTNPKHIWPRMLVTHVTPAYCARGWVQVKIAGQYQLVYVNEVERPGISTEKSNGSGPCFWHVEGYPHPWYFPNGHEHVSQFTEHRGGGDD